MTTVNIKKVIQTAKNRLTLDDNKDTASYIHIPDVNFRMLFTSPNDISVAIKLTLILPMVNDKTFTAVDISKIMFGICGVYCSSRVISNHFNKMDGQVIKQPLAKTLGAPPQMQTYTTDLEWK